MILHLVEQDDPSLQTPSKSFDFSNPPTDPIELAKNLYETMLHHKGLGLAAPQVGIGYRVFAMASNPGIVCFNPRLIDTSEEHIVLDEGCLTFPNLFVKMRRPRRIKVRYTEPNGNVVTQVFEGMTARCFLHELDHLDGILYTLKANKIHLDRARREQKKLNRLVKRAEAKGLL